MKSIGTEKVLTSKKELKLLKNMLKGVFVNEEITGLITLKDTYKNVFKSKASVLAKLNRLLDVLMQSTAYLERLTTIKNDLYILDKRSKTLFLLLKKEIYQIEGFKEMKKKDQDITISTEIGQFKDFIDLIENRLKIVDNAINFIDKLQFSIKTAVSALKEVYQKEAPDSYGSK